MLIKGILKIFDIQIISSTIKHFEEMAASGKVSSTRDSQFKAQKGISEIDWLIVSEGMVSQKFREE
jgi:hypothetical protein